jgi:hypothetical protein
MADELRKMCRKEPFEPFRVITKSGERFDVFDPYECLIATTAVVLPVRVADLIDANAGYPAFVDLDQVTRLERISRASVNGV